jgi:hypothetical protein
MTSSDAEDPELPAKYAALLKEFERFAKFAADPDFEIKLAIFDRIPMPVWACDRACRIVLWNESAARLYDYPAAEAVGKDFVDLFVNDLEKEKARVDCVDIIDNNHIIRNMADDIDKHKVTKNLVTHCFPVYNAGPHAGLQVEISYEIQGVERLEKELRRLQEQSRAAEEDRKRSEEDARRSHQRLIELLSSRALEALSSVVNAKREDFRGREDAITKAALAHNANKDAVAQARADVKVARDKLIAWETEYRRKIVSSDSDTTLEDFILRIERMDELDV